jgi:hypothetical protein
MGESVRLARSSAGDDQQRLMALDPYAMFHSRALLRVQAIE